MRIVIADDEKMVRLGIISMLEEMDHSWHIAGEAANGEELVQLVSEFMPEIAIVDIRMPKMDGLQAIRQAREMAPHTKWIILSGFSDFEYAREALKLGTTEYLLKPVSPDDLEQAITAICKDNRQYLDLLNNQFETTLFSLLHGLSTLQAEAANSPFHQWQLQAAVFFADGSLTAQESAKAQCEFSCAIREAMNGHLTYGAHFALVMLPGGELATVGTYSPSADGRSKDAVNRYFAAIGSVMLRFHSSRISITAIQTEWCRGFQELTVQLEDIRSKSGMRIILGLNKGWRLERLNAAADEDVRKLGEQLEELVQLYKDKMVLNYLSAVEKIYTAPAFSKLLSVAGRRQALAEFIKVSLPVCIPQSDSADDWQRALKHCGEQLLESVQNGSANGRDIVEQTLEYIERHYMKEISIGQIAGDLNITPNYLSSLFHKKTGTPFIKYLTKVRMLQAKRLLSEGQLQVRQVAEQVGYYSTRHFTKLFTEFCGCYPSEYKKGLNASVRNECSSQFFNV